MRSVGVHHGGSAATPEFFPLGTGAALSESTRVNVLRTIATHYRDLVEPLNGRNMGVPGDGDSVSLMPRTYTPTVREFERLMVAMREDRQHSLILVAPGMKHSLRACRWHINAWYIEARTVIVHKPKQVKKGKRIAIPTGQEILRDESGEWLPTITYRRTYREPGANQQIADAGLTWMAATWTAPFEPMLPNELLDTPRAYAA